MWAPVLTTGYASFFAVYLVLLPSGAGRWAPLIADLAVAAAITWTWRRPSGSRWVALTIVTCALVMAVQLDGHGLGIVVGVLIGLSCLNWQPVRSPAPGSPGRSSTG